MIRKITLLFLLCVATIQAAYAQPTCGFDPINHKLLTENTAYAQRFNQMNQQLAQCIKNNNNIMSLLTTNRS